ncbi:MAG: hypothetical protein V1844_24865 [Pseudomonadota bacterium]
MVNGVAIARLVLRPPGTAPGDSRGDNQQPVQYTLDIQTTPNPLKIPPDGKTTGTVYARVVCTDPKVDTSGLTGSIDITLQGGAVAFVQKQDGMTGGYRYLSFMLSPPMPGQFVADLMALVSVYVEGMPMTASIPVEIDVVQGVIETTLNPEGKNWLMPLGMDQVWVYAKVNVPENLMMSDTDKKAVKDSIDFKPLGGGEWIPGNKAVECGEWMAWLCEFYDANSVRGGHGKPPDGFTVQVTAQLGGQQLSKDLPFTIKPMPEVRTKPDRVDFLADSGESVEVTCWIENSGDAKWTWRTEWEDGKGEIVSAAPPVDVQPGVIKLTLTEKHNKLTSGEPKIARIIVFAEQSDKKIQVPGSVLVQVGGEGLIVRTAGMDGEGRYVLRCDNEALKKIDFIVFVKDESGKLTADPGLAKNLWFEDNCEDTQKRNLLSVAKPEIKPLQVTEEKGFTWSFRSQNYVPGEMDNIYSIPMIVRVIGKEEKPEFSSAFTLGLKVMEPDIGSDDWRKERDGCYKAIKFVPEPAQSRLREMIDRHAQLLGHEGLKFFRKKIWRIAQDLILAEGAEGYKAEAMWADRCLFLAENLKWGTDIVMQAAAGAAFGPVGIIGAPMLKSLVEKVLVVAYERGFGELDNWFWECVTEAEQTLDWPSIMKQGALVVGGIVTDPAVLENILGKSLPQKAAAWVIYVGYQFASNMARGMSMCDAIKQTLLTVRDRAIVQFLMGRMKWEFNMPQGIKDAAARMTGDPPRMTEADMLAIQSDPQLLRSLKNAPANIQKGFLQTYGQTLIAPHDAQLIDHVRSLPEYQGRVVRVETFSTPGKSGGGVGADRDFRVTMQNPDGTWSEVPSRLWRDQSNNIVRNLSGGRTLQQLNWRATDRFDIEASPDYATQNGQIANITNVIRGKSTLRDPAQFGNMWQQKMSGVESGHSVPPLEGVAQAQKACNTLNAVRGGYEQQGYNIGNLTPQMQKGIQIVQNANVTATGDFSQVNQALQKAGFNGGFNEFANKVAGQFHALGMARKG